jgi:hypothetical protein
MEAVGMEATAAEIRRMAKVLSKCPVRTPRVLTRQLPKRKVRPVARTPLRKQEGNSLCAGTRRLVQERGT